MSTTTTTTATPVKKVDPKIDLKSFLELKGLTRAEIYYYYNHNLKLADSQQTVKDWEKSIELQEKK